MSWRDQDSWRWSRRSEGLEGGSSGRRPYQIRPTSPGERSDYDSLYAFSPSGRSDRYRSGGESEGERGWRPPSHAVGGDRWTDALGGVPRRYDVLSNREGDMETPGSAMMSASPAYRYESRYDNRYEPRYESRDRYAVERHSLPRGQQRNQFDRQSLRDDDVGRSSRIADRSMERAGSPRTLHEYSSFLLEEIEKTRSDNAWLQREIDVTKDDNERLRPFTDVDSIQSSAVPVPPSPERRTGWSQPRGGTWRIRLRSAPSGFVDVDVAEDSTVAELSRMVPGGGPAPLLFAGHRLPPGETLRRAGLRDGDVLDIAPPDQPPVAPPPQLPPQRRLPGGYSPSPPPADVAAEMGVVAALQEDTSTAPTDASAERAEVAALERLERDEASRSPPRPQPPAGVSTAEEARKESEPSPVDVAPSRQNAPVESPMDRAKAAMVRAQSAAMLAAMVRSQNQRRGDSVLCYIDGVSVFKGEYAAYLASCHDKISRTVKSLKMRLPNKTNVKPNLPAPSIDSTNEDIAAYNGESRGCFYNIWLPLRRKLEEEQKKRETT